MKHRNHRLHYMDMYPQPVKKPRKRLMKSWWWLLLLPVVWYFKVPVLGFIIAIAVMVWNSKAEE